MNLLIKDIDAFDADAASTIRYTVKASRLALGLTQEQLAIISGVSIKTVCGLEQGAREPGVVTLMRLASAMSEFERRYVTPQLPIPEPEPKPAKKGKSNGRR